MPLPDFFEPDGILGTGFIGRNAVYVDQAKLAVRPASTEAVRK
jgi:hypothetical protein